MSSKKAVDLLKEIVKRFQTTTGFEQVLKHVSSILMVVFFISASEVQ